MVEIATVAANCDAAHLGFAMCGPIINSGGCDDSFMPEPHEFVRALAADYATISQIMEGKFSIEMGAPSCIWPEDVLTSLEEGDHLSYGCHFKRRSGLIFDPEGKVLTCNHLYDHPMGQFGEDFWDRDSFAEFWKRPEADKFYNKMLAYPAQKCVDCEAFVKCGGGCPLLWLVREPIGILEKGG